MDFPELYDEATEIVILSLSLYVYIHKSLFNFDKVSYFKHRKQSSQVSA